MNSGLNERRFLVIEHLFLWWLLYHLKWCPGSLNHYKLSESLPLLNLSVLVVLTLLFMGLYAYQSMFGQNIRKRVPVFLARVLGAYLITYLVVCLILFSLNQFPIIDNWVVAVKRALIIAMPASMGAIIVDSFDKE
ncbi:DUF2391 family protein [Photobacterium halotolerans]|uniref:DUF2391 family protein n=1 Tax=Photobacterium halotolerans TaxID=265726 RepID=UPI002E0FBB79